MGFKNITNLDMVKFTLEGIVSFAQMISSNIDFKVFYLQSNAWIALNASYYDQESTQLTTTFMTRQNERGVYTNNIKFKLHNIAPASAHNYEYIANEYLHIVGIHLYANYMPFYCPTSLITNGMFFSSSSNQIAKWQYIETYKLCNNEADCIDASDEVFCSHNGLKSANQKVSLGAMLQHKPHGMRTNDAIKSMHCVIVVLIISSIHCLF